MPQVTQSTMHWFNQLRQLTQAQSAGQGPVTQPRPWRGLHCTALLLLLLLLLLLFLHALWRYVEVQIVVPNLAARK